jgi:hypothetical protein
MSCALLELLSEMYGSQSTSVVVDVTSSPRSCVSLRDRPYLASQSEQIIEKSGIPSVVLIEIFEFIIHKNGRLHVDVGEGDVDERTAGIAGIRTHFVSA